MDNASRADHEEPVAREKDSVHVIRLSGGWLTSDSLPRDVVSALRQALNRSMFDVRPNRFLESIPVWTTSLSALRAEASIHGVGRHCCAMDVPLISPRGMPEEFAPVALDDRDPAFRAIMGPMVGGQQTPYGGFLREVRPYLALAVLAGGFLTVVGAVFRTGTTSTFPIAIAGVQLVIFSGLGLLHRRKFDLLSRTTWFLTPGGIVRVKRGSLSGATVRVFTAKDCDLYASQPQSWIHDGTEFHAFGTSQEEAAACLLVWRMAGAPSNGALLAKWAKEYFD